MNDWRSKPRKKRSKIWVPSYNDFKKIVESSSTLSDILKHFGLDLSSSSYTSLKERLRIENINYSHIPLGLDSLKGRPIKHNIVLIPLDQILVEHSTYSRSALKKRLLKEGHLKNKCYECGIGPEWNGKPLSLQIDHINGISNDNRLNNLRLLCPNCHAQTPTFGSKNYQ